MKPLPASIQVGPYRYAVNATFECIARRRYDDDSATRIGHVAYAAQEIDLDPALAPDHRAAAILHETLHAIWDMLDLPNANIKDDEAVLRPLAPLLLDTLRRNPDLVAFLVGDSDDG